MLTFRDRWVLGGWILLFATVFSVRGQSVSTASIPPDATVFTTYTSTSTFVSWIVCGSVGTGIGCYASGTLGPFGKVGALMESQSFVNPSTNTVTRLIYVIDIASGNGGNGVMLHVYKKTDVVSSGFDTATVVPLTTVALPLTGGSTARCSMAANSSFLFIGTDQSTPAVRVQKNNFIVTKLVGFGSSMNVTGITANNYGYVAVVYGTSSGLGSFYVYGPDGASREDGGGTPFMLNTITAVSTATLP
jgi:hypothetical protein